MKIIRPIDRGGFGRVDEAELPDGTRIAVKTFDPDPTILKSISVDKLRARFKREVRSQSLLSSEFAIPILSSDLNVNEMWYSMPLCARNFQTQIFEDRDNGNIPREALSDILSALEELHLLGLRHRDLNPRNILLHDGKWKLADFGLVSPLPDSASNVSSSLGAWGTFPYMAPEQSLDFKHVEITADIYAFGCILHDIFGDGQRIPLAKHTCEGPVGMVIERCTELDPARRFQNVTALRGALFTILAEPLSLKPSMESVEWAERLASSQGWDTALLREFARFVARMDDPTDLWRVYIVLDEDAIERFYELDTSFGEMVIISYCEWVEKTGFDYEMCDVIAQRLRRILKLGTIEVQAGAILAIAKLGKSHHRFYVMRVLAKVASPEMDENLARRVTFEIQVNDAYWNFIDSATGINNDITNFHPFITHVLEERINRYKK